MTSLFYTTILALLLGANTGFAQHMEMTAESSGNSLVVKLKAVNGNVVTGWSDIEFFLRNPTTSPEPDFATATIVVNTTDFPGVSIPYNGEDAQGTETGYKNYWFGISFSATTAKTYIQEQEYVLCTITSPTDLTGTNLELVHNDGFVPHYIALTSEAGVDRSNLSGGNKFYGLGAITCSPVNCPPTTPGANDILPVPGTFLPLPAELLTFSAAKVGRQQAMLTWETAAEEHLREFRIERSRDGRNWEKIGVEAAKGSHTQYSHLDNNPPAEVVYYRLDMQNLDGTKAYSPVRSVTFHQETGLTIAPNPSDGLVHLIWNTGEPASKREMQLFDLAGRLVLIQTTESNTAAIAITGLAAGAYWLRIRTGAETSSHQIIRL